MAEGTGRRRDAAPRLRGIVFDKDGTLVDFEATWGAAYREAAGWFARRGRRCAPETLLADGGLDAASGRVRPGTALACESTAGIAAAWARRVGLEAGPRLVAELDAVFTRRAVAHAVPTVPGLAALLGRLREAGLELGLATMDGEASARAMLARLGLARSFDFVCGYDSGCGAKPGPGMVRAFCRARGLAAREVAVVGDSTHDLAMARAAGAGLAVGVLGGTGGPEDLGPLADVLLPDVGALESVLSGACARAPRGGSSSGPPPCARPRR